mgnify:CR=1 FL=1
MTDNPYYNKVEAWRVSVSGSVSVAETACLVGTLGMGLHLTPTKRKCEVTDMSRRRHKQLWCQSCKHKTIMVCSVCQYDTKIGELCSGYCMATTDRDSINVTWVTSTFNWHVFSNDLSTSFILQCCHEHWKPWWPRRLPKVSFSAWVCLIWEKWTKTPRSYRH